MPVDDAAAVGPLVGGPDQVPSSRRVVLPGHQQQVSSFTDQERGIFCRTSESHEGSCSCLASVCTGGRLAPFLPLSL